MKHIRAEHSAVVHQPGTVTGNPAFGKKSRHAADFPFSPRQDGIAANQAGRDTWLAGQLHALKKPARAIRVCSKLGGIRAQIQIGCGQQERVREDDFQIHAGHRKHRAGAVDAGLRQESDAFDGTENAREEGVQAQVTRSAFGRVEPHMVGGIVQPGGDADAVYRIVALPAGGLGWRIGRAQVDIAIAVGVAAATAQQRRAIGNESRDGGGGAILRERFAQIRALRVFRVFPIVRIYCALLIARRRASLWRVARDRDHFPERGFVAILHARFLEKRAVHGLCCSPPSAMVMPRVGESNA